MKYFSKLFLMITYWKTHYCKDTTDDDRHIRRDSAACSSAYRERKGDRVSHLRSFFERRKEKMSQFVLPLPVSEWDIDPSLGLSVLITCPQ